MPRKRSASSYVDSDSFEAMRREVMEETGLKIEKSWLLFEYRTSAEVPCTITVFEVEASGNLVESWEGSPRWLSSADIRHRVLPSQKVIIDRIN